MLMADAAMADGSSGIPGDDWNADSFDEYEIYFDDPWIPASSGIPGDDLNADSSDECDIDFGDLEIPVEIFTKVLEEGNESLYEGSTACDRINDEMVSQCQAGSVIPEDLERLELFAPKESSSHMTLPDDGIETCIDLCSEPLGSSDSLSGLYHPSLPYNLKDFCSSPLNHSLGWASSSDQYLGSVYPIRSPFRTYGPDNHIPKQFQVTKPIYNDPTEGSLCVNFVPTQNAEYLSDFQCGRTLENYFDPIRGARLFEMGIKGGLKATAMPSSSIIQNGTGILSNFDAQGGLLEPLPLIPPSVNSNVPSMQVDIVEMNPSISSTCDDSEFCASLPFCQALRHDSRAQKFQAAHCIVNGNGHPSQKACGNSDVKLITHCETFGSFWPTTNLNNAVSLPAFTSSSQNQGVSFKHEPTISCSHAPFNKNSSACGSISACDKPQNLVHEVKKIMQNKKEDGPLEERKDDDDDDDVDDDDDDVCIVSDFNSNLRQLTPSVCIRPHPLSLAPQCGVSDPHITGSLGARPRLDDERLTFHIALQGLGQPKSEACPPNGVLAVPLLRHQRIALSWMVQKETSSLHCSGGILADDQGLGKTVSTIALILTQRSPSSKLCSVTEKHIDCEALNLDDDDENGGYDIKLMKKPRLDCPTPMTAFIESEHPVSLAKGRPAAGTLVVCPTSVLRQWADELQTKVTDKAKLSFLLYYGSNRTRDPTELASYDVVITTYAIVSMEVPKQPLVDKNDEDKEKPHSCAPVGHSIGKNRKNNHTKNNIMIESVARPLAKVNWFRVILDEAQSIKNHRTQVARACWGLRAKRRWCLSGTPIQNAVDDLYSYFRFLRYDPYAVYKSFCSTIKMPISRNPGTGYKKLQAVLKTIMLRRTKGTIIEGKPIITLPPKTVELKKVDFSLEERTFYSTLEAESRELFQAYADAGTVKQNYVNILLMLLRLRQACDHPLLVKGYDSNLSKKSIDTAKNLSRDKQIYLLNCLEASLDICTICNDSPEDAVVTICGHVFCNQCISDHLTGDDNICPSAACKVQLTGASVFSKCTLKSCLCESTSGHGGSRDSSPSPDHRKLQEDSMSSNSSKIRAAIEILRSLPLCCDPSLNFEKSVGAREFTEKEGNLAVRQSLFVSGAKHSEFKSSVNASSQATEKAIVFSQWTRMLDLVEIPLKDSRIQYRRLDGTMSVSAREKAVKDFNSRPEVTVMIMSLKAASLGLNLVSACHVLLLDLWWNPTTEDQAIDRAHRIGQIRPVTVSRLTVNDTVEDRILALQGKKREMVASAFGEDESGGPQTRLTEEDLRYLFMV